MTEASEQRIIELEAEVAALKDALAAQQDNAVNTRKYFDIDKIRSAIDDGTKSVIEAIKPVVEKYEEPSRAAVARVGGKVSDNPFLSVVVAFGAGIVIGKILDCCCRGYEEE